MTDIVISQTDPNSYTTQFLLLLSQLVHEMAVPKLMVSNSKPVWNALQIHPLLKDAPKGFLNEWQVVELFNALLKQYDLSPSAPTDEEEEQANSKSKHAPEYITRLCEILYEKRIEEIETELAQDKETFSKRYKSLIA